MDNMVKLDERLVKAIDLLYRSQSKKRTNRAIEILHEAKDEGVSDAWYFLARCYYGEQFEYLGIKPNKRLAECYLFESIERGSAFGTIGAFRVEDVSIEYVQSIMKYRSFAQARDVILQYAKSGEGFSQYMIANMYYWMDVFYIDNIRYDKIGEKKSRFASISWFERAMQNGIYLGVKEYANIFIYGQSGIGMDLNRADGILKRAADDECLKSKLDYGIFLDQTGRYKEAAKYLKQAATKGYAKAWSYLGDIVIEHARTRHDEEAGLKCYAAGEKENDYRSIYKIALLYYYGTNGTQCDYKKSFEMFYYLGNAGFDKAFPYVGMHYFYGRGTNKNYELAKRWFEMDEDFLTSSVHIGIMYEKGLVYEKNIDMAVKYMSPCVNDNEYAKNFMNSVVQRSDGHWEIVREHDCEMTRRL